MGRYNIWLGWLGALLSCGMVACVVTRPPDVPVEEPQKIWPAPPAEPRITFVRSFAGPADLGIRMSRWRSIFNFIVGLGGKKDNVIKPFGLAFDEEGNICLTDTGVGSVTFLDRATKRYKRWEQIGKIRFMLPVAVAKAKHVFYVADSGLKEIIAFDDKGELQFEIKHDIERPSGLVICGEKLYVADSVAHCIAVFDLHGKFLSKFGERGSARGNFNCPTHITTDNKGHLLVTDAMNGRVEVFDLEGHIQAVIGNSGDHPGQFGRPKGVGVDSFGHVYVADAIFDNIQVFDLAGQLLMTWGEGGSASGEFWIPEGLAINRENEIVVADSYNQRVQIFKYIGAP